nr:outer membrane beta-barrel protein [uncultured Cohaesibacter sp.]
MRQHFISSLLIAACLPLSPAMGQQIVASSSANSEETPSENAQSTQLTQTSVTAAQTTQALRSSEDAVAKGFSAWNSNFAGQQENTAVGSVETGTASAEERQQGDERKTADQVGPYEPTGLRLGSFLLYPSLTLWGKYTDNVDKADDGEVGRTVSPEVELRLQSDWDRHSLSVTGRASVESYDAPVRTPELSEQLDGELRLDVADETKLALKGAFDQSQEDSNSVELNASGSSATIETSYSAGATLDQEMGSVNVQLRGSLAANRFENEESRNYDTYRLGMRVGLPLTDQLEPFVDGEYSQRRYDDSGNKQNGDSLRGAIGIKLANREKFSGELSAGIISWEPVAAGQADDAALFVSANVVWSPNVLCTIRGGLETNMTSTATPARSVATHSFSLAADYDVLRNLQLTASGNVSHESYNGTGRSDWVFDTTLNATYSFNRNVQFIASIDRAQRDSNRVGEDYVAHTVRVGLKLQH